MDQRIQKHIHMVYTVCPHIACPLLESKCTTYVDISTVFISQRETFSLYRTLYWEHIIFYICIFCNILCPKKRLWTTILCCQIKKNIGSYRTGLSHHKLLHPSFYVFARRINLLIFIPTHISWVEYSILVYLVKRRIKAMHQCKVLKREKLKEDP